MVDSLVLESTRTEEGCVSALCSNYSSLLTCMIFVAQRVHALNIY